MKRFFYNLSGKIVRVFVLALLVWLTSSCEKDSSEVVKEKSIFKDGRGVFILNEGNFGSGNGSLSFLNFDSLKIYNNIFQSANGRPLGDVPFSMTIMDEEGWIVVNNSGKIEVVNMADMKSKRTIEGLSSPRYLLPLNGKVYVSDLYHNKITVINRSTGQIVGNIHTGRSTEAMIYAANRIFAAFWSNFMYPSLENRILLVINPANDQLVDSVVVGKEPHSMVIDRFQKLWVLCSGGYMGDENPTLWRINPQNLDVEKKFTFPEQYDSPSHLSINRNRDSLFFLNQHVFAMSIHSEVLPYSPLIPSNGRYFYSMAIDNRTDDILLSDPMDFQQRGKIYHYSSQGQLKGTYEAGIIPGNFTFN